MYHNANGGGLHVSTNSQTNKAKSDVYSICKREIPGAGQIRALAAYVKALEDKVKLLEKGVCANRSSGSSGVDILV